MSVSDTVFPDEFIQFMGPEWIGRLPALLADCERRWALKAGAPFPNLSYHYVAPVVRADGSAAVLKIGVPSSEFQWQIDALRFYTGNGSVRLLEADGDAGAMLLERLEPGVLLSTLTENGEDEKNLDDARSDKLAEREIENARDNALVVHGVLNGSQARERVRPRKRSANPKRPPTNETPRGNQS